MVKFMKIKFEFCNNQWYDNMSILILYRTGATMVNHQSILENLLKFTYFKEIKDERWFEKFKLCAVRQMPHYNRC